RRAVEAHRNDGTTRTARRIARHPVVPPCAGAVTPRQIRIQGERHLPRQAYLATVRMAAQHEVEPRLDGAAVDLRGVRKEYGIIRRPAPRRGHFDIIGAE